MGRKVVFGRLEACSLGRYSGVKNCLYSLIVLEKKNIKASFTVLFSY